MNCIYILIISTIQPVSKFQLSIFFLFSASQLKLQCDINLAGHFFFAPNFKVRQILIFQVKTRVARWHVFVPKSLFYMLWLSLECKISIYFMAIWYILWPFGIFYGHLVYFMAIWYIL
jgi:hypothetical protein